MEPATRSVEELQVNETGQPFTSLKLPALGHQRSLQNLIEEELSSQDDPSLEMTALLMRRDETPDFDGATTETTDSRTQTTTPKTPTDSASNESRHNHKTAGLRNGTLIVHSSFWSRLFKRYDCHI